MGKFVIRQTATGYKFDLRAANGEVIATSEVYATYASCQKGVESVAKCAVNAGLADMTAGTDAVNPKFELYQDKTGEYRFRLKARNGKIIATSEAYKGKASCENGIESVRNNVLDAPIVTE